MRYYLSQNQNRITQFFRYCGNLPKHHSVFNFLFLLRNLWWQKELLGHFFSQEVCGNPFYLFTKLRQKTIFLYSQLKLFFFFYGQNIALENFALMKFALKNMIISAFLHSLHRACNFITNSNSWKSDETFRGGNIFINI